MKKLLMITILFVSTCLNYALYAANTVTPPPNCIQYTDECGNMCIKKRNNTRSCNKIKSCTVYQNYMCVSIVNDVDLDERKNKIKKEKYIPQVFWSLYTNNQITNPSSNNTTSNNTPSNNIITMNPITGLPELYSPDLKGSTTTSSIWTSNSSTQTCNNEDKPVCGMVPLVCAKAPCFPVIQTYKNECSAKSEWALYLQRWICSVKNNIRK